jgi:hypothetical protein
MRCEENIVAPVRSETIDLDRLDRLSQLAVTPAVLCSVQVTQLFRPVSRALKFELAVPVRKGKETSHFTAVAHKSLSSG